MKRLDLRRLALGAAAPVIAIIAALIITSIILLAAGDPVGAVWAQFFKAPLPRQVIAIVNDDDRNPRLKCLRGDAHNIAVELGLKRGQVFKGDAGDLRLAAVA